MTVRVAVRRAFEALRSRPVTTLVATVAGLALVMGAVVVVRLSDETTDEALMRLDQHAAAQSVSIDEVVNRATRDLRLASRNVIFGDALASGTGPVDPASRKRVETALTYMGARLGVDEICLIRQDGLEVARFNGGQVAAVADLSPDESPNNPAVIPTLALGDDETFRTDPYVSPDSGRWVLGLATPIIRSGQTLGILHFELPIAAMSEAIAAPFGASGYSFTLTRDGRLLTHPRIADFRAAAGCRLTSPPAGFLPRTRSDGRGGRSPWPRSSAGIMTAGRSRRCRSALRFAADADPRTARPSRDGQPGAELFAAVRTGQLDLLVTLGPLAA